MGAAVAVVLGLLLGGSGPIALGALTTFQIAQLAVMGIKIAPKALKTEQQIIQLLNSPAFAQWVAANGDAAIRLQPGLSTER